MLTQLVGRVTLLSMAEMSGLPPLSRALRQARERAGLSQYKLADAAGVSRATIANIEGGQDSANSETLQKLADALGVGIEELAGKADRAGAQALVERFLASEYGQYAHPTDDELRWLRSLPDLGWLGSSPTPRTIEKLLEAYRASKG